MAEVIKKATREGYAAALEELASNPDVIVMDADLGAATKSASRVFAGSSADFWRRKNSSSSIATSFRRRWPDSKREAPIFPTS